MNKGTVGEARVHVSAAPEVLYDMVTDVTRMGEWSPETVRCEWLDGATGPAQGARFKGTNKRGVIRWSTKPEVVVADRGREFSFVTHSIGPSTKWTYRFEPSGGGTDLIESFETLDDDSALLTFLERYVMRIDDRKADLEAGMRRTLERIKAIAEASV
ncbi:MAG TPA: SRPBCC family protein [Acidimicrobiales bacterium]